MLEVRLTYGELMTAAVIGVLRQAENLCSGRRDAHGASRSDGWGLHIEGAAGEAAFAKAVGAYWSGNLGDLAADDVGRTQVRTTAGHNNRLIIHPSDPDDRIFVLVTGRSPQFVVRGWIYGQDAKREEWWADPTGGRPAYFVPQDALHPFRQEPPDA